jgi:hypothetical protein
MFENKAIRGVGGVVISGTVMAACLELAVGDILEVLGNALVQGPCMAG